MQKRGVIQKGFFLVVVVLLAAAFFASSYNDASGYAFWSSWRTSRTTSQPQSQNEVIDGGGISPSSSVGGPWCTCLVGTKKRTTQLITCPHGNSDKGPDTETCVSVCEGGTGCWLNEGVVSSKSDPKKTEEITGQLNGKWGKETCTTTCAVERRYL